MLIRFYEFLDDILSCRQMFLAARHKCLRDMVNSRSVFIMSLKEKLSSFGCSTQRYIKEMEIGISSVFIAVSFVTWRR